MKHAEDRAPEQSPFVCILATSNGSRRYRTAVMADDGEDARQKAERIARDMIGHIEVEAVYSITDPLADSSENYRTRPSQRC
jgi:hypothetical protein